MQSVKRPRRYLFTSKKATPQAVMSLILGILSVTTCLLAFYKSYRAGGEAMLSHGAAVLLALFFCIAGIILALLSLRDEDTMWVLSAGGLVLNLCTLVMGSVVLYHGVL